MAAFKDKIWKYDTIRIETKHETQISSNDTQHRHTFQTYTKNHLFSIDFVTISCSIQSLEFGRLSITLALCKEIQRHCRMYIVLWYQNVYNNGFCLYSGTSPFVSVLPFLASVSSMAVSPSGLSCSTRNFSASRAAMQPVPENISLMSGT